MKAILAPVDLSDVSEAVLKAAVEEARAHESSLYLLHVAPPDPDFVGYEPGPDSVRLHLAEKFRNEHRTLEDWKHRFSDEGVHVEALLIQGATVEKILLEQRRIGASMIVMGSHGHGALYHLLTGSVTAGVLKDATCPVLVVPARRP